MSEHRVIRPKLLSPEAVDRLEAAAGSDRGQPLLAARDAAIVRLLYVTGLRLFELCALNVGDVDWDAKRIHVERGRGGRRDSVFANEAALERVEAYLDCRPEEPRPEDALFLSRKGRRLSRRQVEAVVQSAGERAGLGPVHPQMLRRACGTELLRRTGDLRLVQRALRHSRTATAAIYARALEERVAEAMDGL